MTGPSAAPPAPVAPGRPTDAVLGGVCLLAVLVVSAAAVLVRLAEGMHPVAVALWRTGAAAALLAPFGLRTALRMDRRDLALSALAGALLAGHFWAWFASLHATAVLRSTVLVTLAPVWAGLIEWAALRRPPRARFWAGVAVAVAGAAWMSGGADGGSGGAAGAGDGLALLGGMLAAGYMTLGRQVRQRAGIAAYATVVCAAAAAVLALVAPAVGASPVPPSAAALAAVAAVAAGPQLVGHVGLNWAMRWLPASYVSGLVLFEPVGATLLAWSVLGEPPPVSALPGALLVVAGVAAIVR